MSARPVERRTTGLWPLPFGLSAREAEAWLKRGEALGSLLNLALRRRRLSSGLGKRSAPKRIRSQPR